MSVPDHMLDDHREAECPRCAKHEAMASAREGLGHIMIDWGVPRSTAQSLVHGAMVETIDSVGEEVEMAVKHYGGRLCQLCLEDLNDD